MKKPVEKLLVPLKSESLIEVFIRRFEKMIFSGQLEIGQKLPPEREMAMQLGVSRPVVHEGLLHLAAKGLVTMKPRAGTTVNDYRKDGSLALLTSFLKYNDGKMDRNLLGDVVALRMLVESETAGLAALKRGEDHLAAFDEIIERENDVDLTDIKKVADVNFDFHHQVALASQNMIYPLLVNTTKQHITNPSGRFYKDPAVVSDVFELHEKMAGAIKDKDPQKATSLMRRVLEKEFLVR
jgi:GntR family transcriptional regulator, transcriptional repressor for pyruvate dehydrogenase complex